LQISIQSNIQNKKPESNIVMKKHPLLLTLIIQSLLFSTTYLEAQKDHQSKSNPENLVQMIFYVNMNNEYAIDPIGVYIAGDFTGWQPQILDTNGNGIYSRVYFLEEDSTYEYRFLNGVTNFENIFGDCVNDEGNRTILIPIGGGQTFLTCFNICDPCPDDCEDPFSVEGDDFENYTIGDISSQNSNWTTWPGADLGGQVSTDFAASGEQSLHISGADFTGQDVLYLLGDHKTGHTYVEWKMYIPENKAAYFNIQHQETTGNWAFNVQFDKPNAFLNIWDRKIPFDFPYDEWFFVAIIFDLDNDIARLIVDNVSVGSWQFSIGDLEGDGSSPAPTDQTLGAINFFGFDDSSYDYYIDDFGYYVLPKPIETQYCQTAEAITPGIHAVPDFDCPGGFDFENDAFSAAWYTFTPDEDGWITVSSCGNGGNDTRVWLFAGEDCTDIETIGINDDLCYDGAFGEFASYRQTVVEAGKTYWIVWDNPWNEEGFEFELLFNNGNPAEGNFCQTAWEIDLGNHNIVEFDGNAAVSGPNLGTDASLGQTPYVLSEWYQFTPISDMEIDIFSCDLTTEDTRLWIYSGNCATFETLKLIASSDDYCDAQSGVYNFSVLAGKTYYFEWDNNFNSDVAIQGHDFTLQESPPAPVSVTFTVDMTLYTDFGGIITSEGMHLAGDFQDWNPANSPMTDNGDGTWSVSFFLVPGEEIFYKYVLGDDWMDGNEGTTNSPLSDCGVDDGNGGFNRSQIIPDSDIEYLTCYDRCVTCDLVNTNTINLQEGISIFPNPTSDYINIQFDLPESIDLEWILMNNLGQTILKEKFENTSYGKEIIDCSNLASGVYFLSFYSDQFVGSQRVVVE
jgi:hypothetical protein